MVDVDALTGVGVGNGRFFDRSLGKIWSKMDEVVITLLMIDIDRFKKLNDAFGHRVGDMCLREVAQTLSSEVREIGLCSRYGGEEFAVILTGVDADMAFGISDRLRRKVEASIYGAEKNGFSVTISIGCATRPPNELARSSISSMRRTPPSTGRNTPVETAFRPPPSIRSRPKRSRLARYRSSAQPEIELRDRLKA